MLHRQCNVQFLFLIEYVNTLMHKTVKICLDEEDKPTLPDTPPALASAYEHPDKDLNPLFSRYKN